MFKAPVLASFYVSNPRASGAQRVAADVGGWNNPPARRRDQDEDIGQMMDAMWLDDRGARGGAGAGGGAIGDLDMRWINNEDPNRGDHQHHLHHHYLHHRHIRPARNDGGIMVGRGSQPISGAFTILVRSLPPFSRTTTILGTTTHEVSEEATEVLDPTRDLLAIRPGTPWTPRPPRAD